MRAPGPSAFFVPEGTAFRATELTRGPWNEAHQHGGPGAGLLARALARAEPEANAFRLARVWIEFVRPVPIAGRFEVRVGEARAGRQAQRLDAALTADGVEVARASGLRLRITPLANTSAPSTRALPPPESAPSFAFPFFTKEPAYHTAMDVRIVEGRWGELPVGAWGRPRVPLVAGEPTSAIERAMILADAESGIGPPLDPTAFAFVNPDLAVWFARAPEGDWTGLRVSSYASADGVGLAESELFDPSGPFGRAAQTLMVRARHP